MTEKLPNSKFDERGYPLEWANIPSVTEVLHIIRDESLENWLREFPKEHTVAENDKAKEIGTVFNETVDSLENEKSVKIDTAYPQELQFAIESYFKWKKENNVKHLASQLILLSSDKRYKGKLDKIMLVNGSVELIELKVTSKIKKEHLMQGVAYKRAFYGNEGLDLPTAARVVRLSKKDVSYDQRKINKYGEDILYKMFMNLLSFYEDWEHKSRMNLLYTKEA